MSLAPLMAAAGLALCLAGCSGARPVQTEVMLAHQNCQTLEAGITPVTLDRVAKIRGSRLISLDPAGQVQQDQEQSQPQQPSGVALFAISKGSMPTPGYGMTLAGAELAKQTLTVQVNWQTPAADAMLAQVITHPCLVIAVPVTDAQTLIVRQGDTEIARTQL
ncbi:MAG: protease complex subunit PrcB family protein [Pseudomonadales bacterium]